MDIVKYFEEITRFRPIPEQKILLNALADITIKNLCVSAGRGFSKTLCSGLATLWFADIYTETIGRPLEILLISSQKRMYKHLNDFFRYNRPRFEDRIVKRGVYTEVPIEGFELTNGTAVETAMPTSKSIRSHRADIAFIDEAAEVPTEIIKTAMGCLTGDICKLVLDSTPHKHGYFTDRASEPKKYGYTLMMFNSEKCPWQKQAVARMKRELSPAEYAAEVLGRPPTKAERAYFPSKHIDKCVLPFVTRENAPQSRVEAGLDFGFDPCRTVLAITEKVFSRRKLLFTKAWRRKPIEDIAEEIAGHIDALGCSLVKADAKPAEYKGHVEKHTKTPVFYIEAPMHKDAMLSQLQRKVRQHQLEIGQDQKGVIIQMRKYRKGKRTGDDFIDALALSCYEPAEPLRSKPPASIHIIKKKRRATADR